MDNNFKLEEMDKAFRKLRIVFARHGQTVENAAEIACGQLGGNLNERGAKQCELLGKHFHENQDKYKFDFIYISDLKRTVDSFNVIASKAEHLKEIPMKELPLIR